MTFDKLCSNLIKGFLEWRPQNSIGWIRNHENDIPIITELTPEFIEEEINWIMDIGHPNFDQYLTMMRKGRGNQGRLGKKQREQIFEVLEEYHQFHEQNGTFDWSKTPYLVLDAIEKGKIQLENKLTGCGDITIETMHSQKGLEFEIVFISQINETFQNGTEEEQLSQEKRLAYMAMTRAREELFLNYSYQLPKPWKKISEKVESI